MQASFPKYLALLLFTAFSSVNHLVAQVPISGTDYMYQQLKQRDANAHLQQQVFESRWQRHALRGAPAARQVYIVPTVIHLVHSNGSANITDAQVRAAIDALNDGLRNRGMFNPATGVDVEIELCLAQRDPQGNSTNGITRTNSPLSQLVMEPQDTLLKDLIRWDPTQYLNIWVVNSITSQASGPGVASYAYYPSAHGSRADGIVGEVGFFTNQRADISVFVQEVGHYFGLFQTFQGGCANNNCLTDGDRVCDTPPDGSTNAVPCTASSNTCQTDEDDANTRNPFRSTALGGLGDQPDMINNYMDRGDPACKDAFTLGQKDRMVLALTTERASLLQSPGCLTPCSTPVQSSFTVNPLPPSVGNTVQLQFNGTGTVTAYEWTVDGNPIGTGQSVNYTFSQAGTFLITLKVTGTTPNCFDIFSDTLEVFCDPRAEINGWLPFIHPGDVLRLTTQGAPGSTYRWLVNGTSVASGTFYNYNPFQADSVIIQLVADNGICRDTTTRLVRVGECSFDRWAIKTHWAFENNLMMDFSVSPPVFRREGSMYGGLINGVRRFFLESSVTISDDNGNLLFYSNGEKIWDRNHDIMPNGDGILGHHSTMQGALAFPDPADPEVYYLFTLDAGENQYQNGLRYTKIDMRLNGGLGDVIPTQKNIFIQRTMLENMHGAYHANGKDVWVVVSNDVSFSGRSGAELVSILVTDQGVQPNPGSVRVISSRGARLTGRLKFSPDGQWLSASGLLYAFDRQTGVPTLFVDVINQVTRVIDTEFSPDNSKLYYTGSSTASPTQELQQYDLSSGNPVVIASSRSVITISSPAEPYRASRIELGKDGKLYNVYPNSQGLHVINNPNLPGLACNFQRFGALFPSSYSSKSINLPAYIRGTRAVKELNLEADNLNPCPGEPVKVWAVDLKGTYELTYELLGQGAFNQSGDTVWVTGETAGSIGIVSELQNACGIEQDTLWLEVKPGPLVDIGPDQVLCEQEIQLTAGFFPNVTYNWSSGEIGQSAIVNQPGTYWVTALDTVSGCKQTDTVQILPPPSPIQPDLGPDQSICPGGILNLSVQRPPGGSVQWWDGSTESSATIFGRGTYWVTVTDVCGSPLSDTIEIDLLPMIPREVPTSAAFCPEEAVTVDMTSTGFSAYQWEDGMLEGIRTFDQIGTYYLQAQDARGCWANDTLDIFEHLPLVPPALPTERFICQGGTVFLNIETTGWEEYIWSDGEIGAVRSFSELGDYTLTAIDTNGCSATQSIQFEEQETRPLRLEARVEICQGDTLLISAETGNFINYQWSDGYLGAERPIWEVGTYSVQAEELNSGCISTGSTEAVITTCPISVYLPNAFSPNNDGHNDWFLISPRTDIVSYHLLIFNRWGEKLFDSQNPFPGWDGTYKGASCPEGVYVYRLEYQGIDGVFRQKNGTITLIR
ncbi:MAG: gliding motility-associated C-terminal domain-containing protein [Bacteroidota bacterium]